MPKSESNHRGIVLEGIALRRSLLYEDLRSSHRCRVRVDLTVRAYTDPYSGDPRWAMVLDSDDLTITPFPDDAEAYEAYEGLVRLCEQDYASYGEHAWHITDVSGIPASPLPPRAPGAPPSARPVPHWVPAPQPPRTVYEVGQEVFYRGSHSDVHGPATIAVIHELRSGLRLFDLVSTDCELYDVRESSIRPA